MKKASPFTYLNRKVMKRQAEYEENQERDLNVFVVTFENTREAEKNIGAGDPFFCTKCKVALNKYSKIYKKADYDSQFLLKKELSVIKQESQIKKEVPMLMLGNNDSAWVCEFCDHHNKIRIQKEQIPQKDDLVYIIQSANQKLNKQGNNEPTLIFCIDNSGSMNTTQEVKGKIKFKYGISNEQLQMLKQFMEPGDIAQLNYFPGQNGANTYVSRKQCVMAAIENQLIELKKNDSTKKVGLITFNNEVIVFGDCQKDPVHLVGDKLYKEADIIADLKQAQVKVPLHTSFDKLINNFNKIEATGATALGPAILSAIEVASKGAPGSSILICTDGLANIGLGALQYISQESKQFYQKLAEKAKSKNIMINILTIKGQGCKIQVLSSLSKQTNGNISIVNPQQLSDNFANILQDQVVGIQVNVQIRLHKSMRFRNQLKQNLHEDGSLLIRKIANATVNTKISFEYELKSDQQLKQLKIDPTKIKSVPFQTQIIYTTLAGHKFMRVITSSNEATTNKKLVQKHVELPVVHTRIAQQSAAWIERDQQADRFVEKQYNKKWMNYLEKNVADKSSKIQSMNKQFQAKNEKLHKAIRHKQIKQQLKVRKNKEVVKQQMDLEAQEALEQELKLSCVDSDEDERIFEDFRHGKNIGKK